MQSSHAATAVDVVFDDPNLIADAGLVPVPVLALARRVALHLPEHWPWEPAWQALHAAIHRPSPRIT